MQVKQKLKSESTAKAAMKALKWAGIILASPIILPVAIVALPIWWLIKLSQSKSISAPTTPSATKPSATKQVFSNTTTANLSASSKAISGLGKAISGLGGKLKKGHIGTGRANTLLACARYDLHGTLLKNPIAAAQGQASSTKTPTEQISLYPSRIALSITDGKYQIPLVLPLGKQPICTQAEITLKQQEDTGQWIAQSTKPITSALIYQLVDTQQEIEGKVLTSRHFRARVFSSFNRQLSQLKAQSLTLNESTKQLQQFFGENFTYKSSYILSLKYKFYKFLRYSREESFLKLKKGVCFEIANTFAQAMNQLGHPVRLVGGYACNASGQISAEGHRWVEVYDTEQKQWNSYDPTRWVFYSTAQNSSAAAATINPSIVEASAAAATINPSIVEAKTAPAAPEATPAAYSANRINTYLEKKELLLFKPHQQLNSAFSNAAGVIDLQQTASTGVLAYRNTQLNEQKRKPKTIIIAQNPSLEKEDFITWISFLRGLENQGFSIQLLKQNQLTPIDFSAENWKASIDILPKQAPVLGAQYSGNNYHIMSPEAVKESLNDLKPSMEEELAEWINASRDKDEKYHKTHAARKIERAAKDGSTFLDLRYGRLQDAPACISQLTQLTELYLDRNGFWDFDKDLFNGLTALTYLDLSFNCITKLKKDHFKGLTALTKLNLVRTNLTSENIAELRQAFPGVEIYADH